MVANCVTIPHDPAEIEGFDLVHNNLLLPPWNHDYYYPFALAPISVLFLKSVLTRSRLVLGLTLIGYLLISPPVPFNSIDRTG